MTIILKASLLSTFTINWSMKNFYRILKLPRYCNLCEHELIADSMLGVHMVHGSVNIKHLTWFRSWLVIFMKQAKGYTLQLNVVNCVNFKNLTWYGSSLVIVTSVNTNPKLIWWLKKHRWRKQVWTSSGEFKFFYMLSIQH